MKQNSAFRTTILDSPAATVCCGLALTVLAVAALKFLAILGG